MCDQRERKKELGRRGEGGGRKCLSREATCGSYPIGFACLHTCLLVCLLARVCTCVHVMLSRVTTKGGKPKGKRKQKIQENEVVCPLKGKGTVEAGRPREPMLSYVKIDWLSTSAFPHSSFFSPRGFPFFSLSPGSETSQKR